MNTEQNKRLLSVREAAAVLGVSYHTARRYVLNGFLPVTMLPSVGRSGSDARMRIDVRDLEKFINTNKIKPRRVGE